VVTSAADLKDYGDRYHLTSRFFEHSRVIQLNGFTDADVVELVNLPASTVPGVAAVLTPDHQTQACRWGQRHPYLLQLAAWYLCAAQRHQRHDSWAKACFMRKARRLPHLKPSSRHWWRRWRHSSVSLPARIWRSLTYPLTLAQATAGLATVLLLSAALVSTMPQQKLPEITNWWERMQPSLEVLGVKRQR